MVKKMMKIVGIVFIVLLVVGICILVYLCYQNLHWWEKNIKQIEKLGVVERQVTLPNGNVVYAPSKSSEPEQKKVSYRVRVSIKNLNIRKGPGTNYDKTGKYTGIGVFTIVAEADGEGATKWGKLKSGAGWISLDYAKKI